MILRTIASTKFVTLIDCSIFKDFYSYFRSLYRGFSAFDRWKYIEKVLKSSRHVLIVVKGNFYSITIERSFYSVKKHLILSLYTLPIIICIIDT